MSDTRTRLLDAATQVMLTGGAQALTLDAVAAAAGVSKGGLLYHFPGKQALVAGMVERFVGQFDAALRVAGDSPGAATRAYLEATISPGASRAGAEADAVTAALFAGALVDPEALVPLRAAYERWQARLADDGIDPVVATAVRLAVDGWWLARLVGLAPPAAGLHERVRSLLLSMTEGGE
ncbi:TetR/AcrR family transcriptional regulator [Phytomonospora endophytica]|uniref:AcrR family transcriptional regulator n=1 Tax=Phytomonospora endophytica TaxID=714109 RepID=A0A841FJ08_9ACTN|nr:TetR/AcrR family transcriptional regulator [Phytomonospora endophytica]MBB6033818.1 AcrR family transcriptional regulator [Phytomonospora endophytica]